nr:retrovirus-related Pol polyprotein from transposon TNT 1-94 [Tanacetum cinerariifolium]
MAAGSRDRPPMLALGRYPQWRSRFLRYVDTRPNGEALRKCILSGPYKPTTVLVQAVKATDDSPAIPKHTTVETPMNMYPENKAHYLAEKEAIHLILIGIRDDIYSTVDACQIAQEIWETIKRLQQGESLNIQDAKTNLFCEFGKFTSHDGESMESYYTRFYKLMNEMIRNNLTVTMMQVNVQFLQQLQPEWSRKPKRVKDFAFHTEKMLLCKQAEQGVPLQAEPYDWLADTNEEVDEQEQEAHYSFMAKIQEIPTADSGTDSKLQSKSVSNTCLVETDDSNVIPGSPDMCEDDIQNEQNDVESDDERVALANLIVNLKLDVDENKKIQKQLKKANTLLAQELKECKAILAETSKSLGESISVRDSCLVPPQTKQVEFEKFQAFNDRTIDYEKLECKLNEAQGQLAHKDTVIREGLKTKAYELSVVKEKHNELMKHSLLTKSHYKGLVKQKTKTQNDIFKFVHELKNEMHVDLKYVESIEKKIDELESDKAEFSNMYDEILQECISKDVMCSYLQSLFDLDALAELQYMYLHKVKECDCLGQKLSKQTESVSKKVHTELLQRFAKLEKHSISLEIALQKCKEQDKNIAIGELKKLIEKGKPTAFLDSLERRYFPKTKSVPKTNVSEGLSKLVTTQTLPQTARKAVCNTNVLKPGMYIINNKTAHTKAPQLPQTVRNTNHHVSTYIGVNHTTNVSRPQLKSNQSKDKVLPNNSQVKSKKTQVEVHPRIPSVSNKMKSVTTCKGSLNSRNLNVNFVCATCNKCLVDSNHFACVTKMLNDVHARTKKPNLVPISARKPKSQANKLVATPNKKKVAPKSTSQKPQSYFRVLYENTNKAWKWWIERQSPSGYTWIVQLILFIVDSGCTKHITGNLKLLCNFVEKKSTCFVRDLQGNDLLVGNYRSDLYTISHQESTSSTLLCLMAKATPTQAWLWHRRLSHHNFDYINLLSKKDIVIGLPKLKYVKDQLCLTCESSKAKRSSFKSKAVPSSKGRLNLLQMDLCGHMLVANINAKKYILVIIDDYSRYTWTLFLRSKDETPKVLKDFLTMIKRNLQAPVINIRTDRGTEFLNKTLNAFFKEEGIEHQTSTARTPEKNDVVERQNHADVPSQQELDLLFGLLYDEYFNVGEKNDQEEEGEQLQDDEFTNPFYALTQEVVESSLHNIGNSNVPTFNQPQMDMKTTFLNGPLKEEVYVAQPDGLQIHQSSSGIFINQAKYTLEILHKHGMDKGQSIGTQMATKPKLDTDLSGNLVDQTDYRSKIGSLMYLTSSRPDIVQASAIAISCNPVQHSRTKHIYTRYHFIKEQLENGIIELYFVRTEYELADMFTKALPEDRFKYLVRRIGEKLVSWSSKKQDYTTLSTVKAEYVSLSACCAQVLWLRTQLTKGKAVVKHLELVEEPIDNRWVVKEHGKDGTMVEGWRTTTTDTNPSGARENLELMHYLIS